MYYTLNIWYFNDEVDLDGIIAEPNPPQDVSDLSDLSIQQLCIFACALPCVLIIQMCDLCYGICKTIRQFIESHRRDADVDKDDAKEESKKKKKGLLHRMGKAGRRAFKAAW